MLFLHQYLCYDTSAPAVLRNPTSILFLIGDSMPGQGYYSHSILFQTIEILLVAASQPLLIHTHLGRTMTYSDSSALFLVGLSPLMHTAILALQIIRADDSAQSTCNSLRSTALVAKLTLLYFPLVCSERGSPLGNLVLG